MTPTPCLHAYPGSYITERVFGYTPDYWARRLKRKGLQRQMIYNPARTQYTCHFNYIVMQTGYIPLLYHPTGSVAYNLVENTLRLILLAHKLS